MSRAPHQKACKTALEGWLPSSDRSERTAASRANGWGGCGGLRGPLRRLRAGALPGHRGVALSSVMSSSPSSVMSRL